MSASGPLTDFFYSLVRRLRTMDRITILKLCSIPILTMIVLIAVVISLCKITPEEQDASVFAQAVERIADEKNPLDRQKIIKALEASNRVIEALVDQNRTVTAYVRSASLFVLVMCVWQIFVIFKVVARKCKDS